MTAEVNNRGNEAEHYGYRVDGKLTGFEKVVLDHGGRDWFHNGGHGYDHERDHQWDHQNHVLLRAEYHYDALDRRVAKKISHSDSGQGSFTQDFVYLAEQDKILLGKSGDTTLTVYLDGEGIDGHLGQVKQNSTIAYMTDHLGSVLNSAAAGAEHVYGVFGESVDQIQILDSQSDPAMYGYTGRTLDLENGQYYYRAREYNPGTGRFGGKDPAGFFGGAENLYSYVQNNPLEFLDPSGETIIFADPGIEKLFDTTVANSSGYVLFVISQLELPGFNVVLYTGSNAQLADWEVDSGNPSTAGITTPGVGGASIGISSFSVDTPNYIYSEGLLVHEFGHAYAMLLGDYGNSEPYALGLQALFLADDGGSAAVCNPSFFAPGN